MEVKTYSKEKTISMSEYQQYLMKIIKERGRGQGAGSNKVLQFNCRRTMGLVYIKKYVGISCAHS